MLKRLIPDFARSATAVKKNQYKKRHYVIDPQAYQVQTDRRVSFVKAKMLLQTSVKDQLRNLLSVEVWSRYQLLWYHNFQIEWDLSHGKLKLARTGFSASASVGYPWLTDICLSNMVESRLKNLGILRMRKRRVSIKVTKKPSKFLDTTLVLSDEIINRQSFFHFN